MEAKPIGATALIGHGAMVPVNVPRTSADVSGGLDEGRAERLKMLALYLNVGSS